MSANKEIVASDESTMVDYFDNSVERRDVAYKQYFPEDEHKYFPDCLGRHYTLSDILNTTIQAGFNILEFNEHPGWVNKKRPGEFTIIARKI